MAGTVEDTRSIHCIVNDYSGADEEHGYTKLEDNTVFPWAIDGDGFRWRDDGRPQGRHTIAPRSSVEVATKKWADRHVDGYQYEEDA